MVSLICRLIKNKYSSNFYFSQYLHCSSHFSLPPALLTAEYKRDPKAFLFSLSNPSGLNFTKVSLLPEKMDQAILCCSNYGPAFGAGPDLWIGNNPNSNNACSARLSTCYQIPAGQKANTFFTGADTFNLIELEVFSFEK